MSTSLAVSGRTTRANRTACGFHHGDFLFRCRPELRARNQPRETHRIGVLQVRIDGGHDDAGFDCDEVDADQRNADPSVNYDAFVQDPIQYID